MKEIVSVKKRSVVKHKEQRWVEFEVQYKLNGNIKTCWMPVENSLVTKLKGNKLKEYLTKQINKGWLQFLMNKINKIGWTHPLIELL